MAAKPEPAAATLNAKRLVPWTARPRGWRARITNPQYRATLPAWKLQLALWWAKNGHTSRP